MKKKLLATLTVIFALALTLAFGISALAAGDGGTEGTSVASDNVELIPKIVSKNVSYASSLHIYYAVPVSTVREGATVSMEFYKSTPDGNSPTYTVTEYEKQKISAITGVNEDYYVFLQYTQRENPNNSLYTNRTRLSLSFARNSPNLYH